MNKQVYTMGEYLVESTPYEVRATRDVFIAEDIVVTAASAVLTVREGESAVHAVNRMAELLGFPPVTGEFYE